MDWLISLQGASMVCGGIALLVTVAFGYLMIKGTQSLGEDAEGDSDAGGSESDAGDSTEGED